MKPILILQSHALVPPGTIADFFADSDHPTQLVKLQQDQKPEAPEAYCGIIILGSPHSINQIDDEPALVRLRDFVMAALASKIPALGICFGSQLLAFLSGAKVTRNPVAELGSYRVDLTKAGLSDQIFDGLEAQADVFQWHSDTFDLPDSSTLLASNATCTNQGFRLGNIVGLQFHPEVEESIVARWCDETEADLAQSGKSKEQIIAGYQLIAASLLRLNYTLLKNFTKTLDQ